MGQPHRSHDLREQGLELRLHLDLKPLVASPTSPRAGEGPRWMGGHGLCHSGHPEWARVCVWKLCR